jgi:hypothetical protein
VIKMKRLGLALMIAAFTFLLVGQATATLSGTVIYSFASPTYTLFVENTGNPGGEDIVAMTVTVPGSTSYTTVAPSGWAVIPLPFIGYYYEAGVGAEIQPGQTLGGFLLTPTPTPTDPAPAPFYTLVGDASGSVAGNAATPEPTTLLLVGIGLIAIAGYAAKKRRQA